jgi:hypothetical protein
MQNSPPNLSPLRRIKAIHRQQPLLFARISFAIALVLLGLSAYFYQPQDIEIFTGFYLFLLSLPFIRLSFPLLSMPNFHVRINTIQAADSIRWHWVGVAIISMVLLTMVNMPDTWIQPWQKNFGLMHASSHVQMFFFCVGLLSLIRGFGGDLRPKHITWKRHYTILLGIIILAGGIRLWNLEYAIHMFVDELLFLDGAVKIPYHGRQILLPTSNAFTDVFSFTQSIIKELIGSSLTTLRLPSVIWSVIGIIGMYALARQFFSVRVALLSAFLVAIMPIHIHFSRVGINNIVGPTLGIWLFVYVMKGIRRQQLGDFAIAGVLLGLTHYFYEGERVFFILFLVLWLLWIVLFCRRDPLFRFPRIKELFVLLFCTLLVILPFYHTLWSQEHNLTQRLNFSRSPSFLVKEGLTDFLLGNELGHIGAPIQRYVQTVAHDDFYQSEDAYILPILVPFFLLGFGVLVWQIRTLHGSLFAWWVLGIAIGNSLLYYGLSAPSPRHVIVYAILMLIVAIGIDTIWDVIAEWVQDLWRPWIHIGFLVYLFGLGLYQVNYYFNVSVPNFRDYVFTRPSIDDRPRPTYDDMILRAVNLPSNTTLHVLTNLRFPQDHTAEVPFFYERYPDEFVVQHTLIDPLTDDYFANLSRDRNHVFTFMPYDKAILKMIEKNLDIDRVEGSPYDIPDEVEMKFYYVDILNS